MTGALQGAAELDPFGLDDGIDNALAHTPGRATDGYFYHGVFL
jgi:hypothetical protein